MSKVGDHSDEDVFGERESFSIGVLVVNTFPSLKDAIDDWVVELRELVLKMIVSNCSDIGLCGFDFDGFEKVGDPMRN